MFKLFFSVIALFAIYVLVFADPEYGECHIGDIFTLETWQGPHVVLEIKNSTPPYWQGTVVQMDAYKAPQEDIVKEYGLYNVGTKLTFDCPALAKKIKRSNSHNLLHSLLTRSL